MVLEIGCLEDALCCQDLNQLSVTSATSAGSTLAPQSEHDIHSLDFESHSDGSESDVSLGDEALAWPVAMVDDDKASLEDEAPAWSTAMVDGDDDYDPRDARFVCEASDGSIAECRRKILDDQIARLDAAVQRRSPQEKSSSALVHYNTVLRELREEAAFADAARGSSSAAALPALRQAHCASLGLTPFTLGRERTSRPCAPPPRAPWVAHDAPSTSLSGGLLEEALFGENSLRSTPSPQRCRRSRRPSRSRSPPRHAAHGAEADDYDVIGSSCYA